MNVQAKSQAKSSRTSVEHQSNSQWKVGRNRLKLDESVEHEWNTKSKSMENREKIAHLAVLKRHHLVLITVDDRYRDVHLRDPL